MESCVCVLEFTVDLNNTDSDCESLKTGPMKKAPLVCCSVQHDPLPRTNTLTAHPKHCLSLVHLHVAPPQALCCGRNSGDSDIIIPRPMSNMTVKSGYDVLGNR